MNQAFITFVIAVAVIALARFRFTIINISFTELALIAHPTVAGEALSLHQVDTGSIVTVDLLTDVVLCLTILTLQVEG